MFFAQVEPTVTSFEPVTTTAEVNETGIVAFLTAYFIVVLIVAIVGVIASWKIFEKAGEAGWKAIIPFYNSYTLFRIAGRNGWWFLALFVPLVNIVVAIILSLDLAKHFGKSEVFGIVGLFLFTLIGYLILGFGDAKYVGTKHA